MLALFEDEGQMSDVFCFEFYVECEVFALTKGIGDAQSVASR